MSDTNRTIAGNNTSGDAKVSRAEEQFSLELNPDPINDRFTLSPEAVAAGSGLGLAYSGVFPRDASQGQK